MTFRPFENPRINTAKQPSQSPSRRRRPPHPGRIDEQRSSAQFAHLQTLRIHMPALKAATSINSRRGLAPAPSAIKAIMAVSHQSSFASHDRSIPPDDKTNRRRNLRTTALRQAVRARKPFGKNGDPRKQEGRRRNLISKQNTTRAAIRPPRPSLYRFSASPEAAMSSAIFPATLERTFGKRNSDAIATRQRMAVPTYTPW